MILPYKGVSCLEHHGQCNRIVADAWTDQPGSFTLDIQRCAGWEDRIQVCRDDDARSLESPAQSVNVPELIRTDILQSGGFELIF